MGTVSDVEMTCTLLVDTSSSSWQKTMENVLKRIQDISYTIDAQRGMAYISGKADPNKIVNIIADAGKHVELVRVDYGYNKPGRTAGPLSLDYPPQYGNGSPYINYHTYDPPSQDYWNNYNQYYYNPQQHYINESPFYYPYAPSTNIPPHNEEELETNKNNYQTICSIM